MLGGYGGRGSRAARATRGAGAARNAGHRGSARPGRGVHRRRQRRRADWLGELVGALADPGVGIVGGRILAADPSNAVERYGEGIHDHQKSIEVFEPPYAITMNWASPRAVLEEPRRLRRALPALSGRRPVLPACSGPHARLRARARSCATTTSARSPAWRARASPTASTAYRRQAPRAFLRGLGHAASTAAATRALGRRAADWARGRDRARAQLDVAFNGARRRASCSARMRYGHLDL